jgi:hypothetical protein
MYLSLSGVFYLANLWNALRSAFNLNMIPSVCITMGFPSRRARSSASNRAPGEILVNEWKGTAIEKALVSIHPERFNDVNQVALSALFVIGNEVYGSRRNLGSLTLGVEMDKTNGKLRTTSDEKGHHADVTLKNIIKHLGTVPQGFADMPEPQARQGTRLQKYACTVCGKPFRAAGEMGRVIHGDDGGQFVLSQPATQTSQTAQSSRQTRQPRQASAAPATQAAAPATATAQPQRSADAENRANMVAAVRAGAAKVVHGRNFGVEEATA